jgi:hypothetical protein
MSRTVCPTPNLRVATPRRSVRKRPSDPASRRTPSPTPAEPKDRHRAMADGVARNPWTGEYRRRPEYALRFHNQPSQIGGLRPFSPQFRRPRDGVQFVLALALTQHAAPLRAGVRFSLPRRQALRRTRTFQESSPPAASFRQTNSVVARRKHTR